MNHIIICREYPPAPGGGIGTYVSHISRLLAERGETVHVIGQLWRGAEKEIEEDCSGKLIIHRVPLEDRSSFFGRKPSPRIEAGNLRGLFKSGYYPQCFSLQASLLAERLIEEERIDVIEAQDYEAPLHYFQLRRAQGLGPKRRPPCFIHLHSPTEFIARHNGWNVDLPRWLMAKQLEDYSILAADSWLCPSRFFARQAQAQYGLPEGSIEIIPYPLGDMGAVQRNHETWSNGSIIYVGRLEKRKGVLEWIEAAVDIARQHPTVRFEFVGANVLGENRILSEALLERLIPRRLRERFVFHGKVDRSAVLQLLSGARIAVVPSRWDNYPNACMEAMASGLPVLASPEGGMVEMIVDGQNGWLAETANKSNLQEALRRVLETPPARIAKMGEDAAKRIRQLCDPQTIIERHLRFRRWLVDQGPKRSLNLPSGLQPAKPPSTASANTRQEELQERIATVRCLIGNPRITFRVFQQVAAKQVRRGRKRAGELFSSTWRDQQ